MKCENCNNEHDGSYGSGRFCSSFCARGFSTKSKRKEINKRVSKRLKSKKHKIIVCSSCGNEIDRRVKYCKDCYKYWNNKELFKKLNIYNDKIPLSSIGKEALEILTELYFNRKYTLEMIYNEFNINVNTTFNFFKKHNINLRNFSEANTTALLEGRLNIETNTQNRHKHGWHTTWDKKKVYYRSSYELKYAKYLDNKKIPYEMEFKRFLYYDTQQEKYRIAIPDFYLPLENTIIEIKGDFYYDEQNIKDKFKSYRNKGYACKLLLENEFIDI